MQMLASIVAPSVNVVKSFQTLTHSLEEVCGLRVTDKTSQSQ